MFVCALLQDLSVFTASDTIRKSFFRYAAKNRYPLDKKSRNNRSNGLRSIGFFRRAAITRSS